MATGVRRADSVRQVPQVTAVGEICPPCAKGVRDLRRERVRIDCSPRKSPIRRPWQVSAAVDRRSKIHLRQAPARLRHAVYRASWYRTADRSSWQVGLQSHMLHTGCPFRPRDLMTDRLRTQCRTGQLLDSIASRETRAGRSHGPTPRGGAASTRFAAGVPYAAALLASTFPLRTDIQQDLNRRKRSIA